MKKDNKILFGLLLLLLSVLFYLIHFMIFKDAHHIFIYLVGDIAFVFVEVLLVSLIIHRMLDERERKQRLKKLNMVIGVFYSELGTRLIRVMVACDPSREELCRQMAVGNKGGDQLFSDTLRWLEEYPFRIDRIKVDWEDFRAFLSGKKEMLLRLLENPNMLEHESFSELLQATLHLIEELEARDAFTSLPDSDFGHLVIDIRRVYGLLAMQWMHYMKHLRKEYPYLFSLAVRLNPFEENASPIVTE